MVVCKDLSQFQSLRNLIEMWVCGTPSLRMRLRRAANMQWFILKPSLVTPNNNLTHIWPQFVTNTDFQAMQSDRLMNRGIKLDLYLLLHLTDANEGEEFIIFFLHFLSFVSTWPLLFNVIAIFPVSNSNVPVIKLRPLLMWIKINFQQNTSLSLHLYVLYVFVNIFLWTIIELMGSHSYTYFLLERLDNFYVCVCHCKYINNI